jgi:hypothetical protein
MLPRRPAFIAFALRSFVRRADLAALLGIRVVRQPKAQAA